MFHPRLLLDSKPTQIRLEKQVLLSRTVLLYNISLTYISISLIQKYPMEHPPITPPLMKASCLNTAE
uniref:Uncharacterized protein n=1 Tax=Arion vulgaris TaxID=1028688 RepID=A0A0B6ZQA6_9EUPU